MYGILNAREGSADKNNPDIKQLQLAPNADQCYLLMVGNGLTQMCAKPFSEMIHKTSSLYGPCHKITVMLQKALDRVIFLPGDLHGGGFHIMQVVYNLFY